MSFVDAEEAPEARSPFSTSKTRSPLPAASRGYSAPVDPASNDEEIEFGAV